MKIQEKTNIKLYLLSQEDNYYFLLNCDVLDPNSNPDGYTYILPMQKSCFEFKGQGQELIVFVEKVDERIKQIYVSQTHWLFMRNIIEKRLLLDVKILKRYPGKVTVAQLRMPGQQINKIALKTLSEEMREKIYIKPAKNIVFP